MRKLALLAWLLCCPVMASAADVTLAWDDADSGVLFHVWSSTVSGAYSTANRRDAGSQLVFTWTGLTAGTYYFVVTAYLPTGAESGYSNEVSATISTVTITACPAGTGKVGVPYSSTLSATGGLAPYIFMSTGSLPGGLVLSESGLLSGTPTGSGTFAFTIKALDDRIPSSSGTLPCSIVIAPLSPPSGLRITNQVVSVSKKSAEWAWSTSSPSDSVVDYGTTTAYGSRKTSSALVVNHDLVTSGLTPNRTYYYRIQSRAGTDVVTTTGRFVTR